jgi:hypothetical protein
MIVPPPTGRIAGIFGQPFARCPLPLLWNTPAQ